MGTKATSPVESNDNDDASSSQQEANARNARMPAINRAMKRTWKLGDALAAWCANDGLHPTPADDIELTMRREILELIAAHASELLRLLAIDDERVDYDDDASIRAALDRGMERLSPPTSTTMFDAIYDPNGWDGVVAKFALAVCVTFETIRLGTDERARVEKGRWLLEAGIRIAGEYSDWIAQRPGQWANFVEYFSGGGADKSVVASRTDAPDSTNVIGNERVATDNFNAGVAFIPRLVVNDETRSTSNDS